MSIYQGIYIDDYDIINIVQGTVQGNPPKRANPPLASNNYDSFLEVVYCNTISFLRSLISCGYISYAIKKKVRFS